MNYYQITFCENYNPYGVGYAIDTDIPLFLPQSERVDDWKKHQFELRDGEFCDFLSTDSFRRVCSEQLQDLLESNKGSNDIFQWLPILVNLGEETRNYYVLHFPESFDVLDTELSTWVKGTNHIIKPVFSKERLKGHSVFSYPNDQNVPLFVSETVKTALEKSKCTGIQFSKCALS